MLGRMQVSSHWLPRPRVIPLNADCFRQAPLPLTICLDEADDFLPVLRQRLIVDDQRTLITHCIRVRGLEWRSRVRLPGPQVNELGSKYRHACHICNGRIDDIKHS